MTASWPAKGPPRLQPNFRENRVRAATGDEHNGLINRHVLAIRAQHHYFMRALFPREHNPEAHSYAVVMVITERDGEGTISLDRSSFAPDLTERLN